jgi:hypothetical protein
MKVFQPSLSSACRRSRPRVSIRHSIRNQNASPLASCSSFGTRSYISTIKRVKASPWSAHNLHSNMIGGNKSIPNAGKVQNADRHFKKAYIALGSNLGDRIAMIEEACNRMSAKGIKVKRTSSLWETEPMYVLEQNNFLNGVCEVCLLCIYPFSLL